MKVITKYPRYKISENGEVYCTKDSKYLNWVKGTRDHPCVSLTDSEGKQHLCAVRRLVYETYIEELQEGQRVEVLDGDKNNCNVNNLKLYVTKNPRKGLLVGYDCLGLNKGTSDLNRKRVYKVYRGILDRCYNSSIPNYVRYGAVGVQIDSEWKDFDNFYEWYKKNYIQGFEIDKDLLSESHPASYNPRTCVFLPGAINATIVHYNDEHTYQVQKNGTVCITMHFNGKMQRVVGSDLADAREQIKLMKSLYLEKLLFWTERYIYSLRSKGEDVSLDLRASSALIKMINQV